jgi:hypothetical protein
MHRVLLDRFPHTRILALAEEHNRAMFYWADIDIRSIRIENSEKGILSALRGQELLAMAVHSNENKSRTN